MALEKPEKLWEFFSPTLWPPCVCLFLCVCVDKGKIVRWHWNNNILYLLEVKHHVYVYTFYWHFS